MSPLRRALVLALAALAGLTAAALAAERRLTDHRKDANSGVLDIAGVRFGTGPDGRLRAIVTMAGTWHNSDLLAGASGGPPGSICLRLWTKADPTAEPPDRLVCATAQATATAGAAQATTTTTTTPARAPEPGLRAEVLTESAGGSLVATKARATATRPTRRSVTLRFSQGAIGRPATVRFVVEATRAGCPRTSCTDRAPEAPRTALLRLRKKR